jgi:hypothetical protein
MAASKPRHIAVILQGRFNSLVSLSGMRNPVAEPPARSFGLAASRSLYPSAHYAPLRAIGAVTDRLFSARGYPKCLESHRMVTPSCGRYDYCLTRSGLTPCRGSLRIILGPCASVADEAGKQRVLGLWCHIQKRCRLMVDCTLMHMFVLLDLRSSEKAENLAMALTEDVYVQVHVIYNYM